MRAPLEFERVGKLLIAEEGGKRFILSSVPPDVRAMRWSGEVYKTGKRLRRLATAAFSNKATALVWIEGFR